MEVVEASSSWLCDFEVFKHLSDAKSSRNANTKLAENILTVEFEVNSEQHPKMDLTFRHWTTLKNSPKYRVKVLKE